MPMAERVRWLEMSPAQRGYWLEVYRASEEIDSMPTAPPPTAAQWQRIQSLEALVASTQAALDQEYQSFAATLAAYGEPVTFYPGGQTSGVLITSTPTTPPGYTKQTIGAVLV